MNGNLPNLQVDGAWAQQFESSGTMAAKPPQQDMSHWANSLNPDLSTKGSFC